MKRFRFVGWCIIFGIIFDKQSHGSSEAPGRENNLAFHVSPVWRTPIVVSLLILLPP